MYTGEDSQRWGCMDKTNFREEEEEADLNNKLFRHCNSQIRTKRAKYLRTNKLWILILY